MALAFLLISAAGLAPIGLIDTASAAENYTLEDGASYWQGPVRTAENITAPNESVTVVDADTGIVEASLTANADGDVDVDTSALEGTYYLNNSSDAMLLEFEIVIQSLTADYTAIHLRNGGEVKHAVLDIDSNRGTFEVEASGDGLNLTERVDGAEGTDGNYTVTLAGGGELEINVSDLEGGNYTIAGQVVDSTASFSTIIDISNPPTIEYVFPETSSEFPNDTRPFEDGGEYWAGQIAVWDAGESGITYQIRTLDDANSLVRERQTNESGHGNIDTSGLEGDYELINSSSGQQVGVFKVKTHTFDVTIGDTTLEKGQTTTLTVSTNRNGSDLVLWADKLNRTETQQVFPQTVRIDGEVILENVSDGDVIQFESDTLDPGTYEFGLFSTDSSARVIQTFVIEAPATPTPTPTETDSGGGGSGGGGSGGSGSSTDTPTATPVPNSTQTPSPTSAPTSSPTPIESSTESLTATQQTTSTESATEAGETTTVFPTGTPGQPGFGFIVALLALTLALFIRRSGPFRH